MNWLIGFRLINIADQTAICFGDNGIASREHLKRIQRVQSFAQSAHSARFEAETVRLRADCAAGAFIHALTLRLQLPGRRMEADARFDIR